MKVRRVVTGRGPAGKSEFVSDGDCPVASDYQHIRGMAIANVWQTKAGAQIERRPEDPTPQSKSVVPGPGGSQLLYVVFPPDSVMMSPDFDGPAAGAENARLAPGLAELFELENPGMHTTPTIDYGIVLDGEIWLELDDGAIRHLREHDVAIQNGTRHAWRNRSNKPTLMAFVLMGAKRA